MRTRYPAFLLAIMCSICTVPALGQSVQYGVFSASALPASVKSQLKGTIDAGLQWRDRLGQNYVLFSTIKAANNSIYLHAKHFAIKDGQPQLLRRIRDHYAACEFDNVTRFLTSSITVTDLDNDGIGEVAFVYFVDCVSDVSPYSAKLMLIEKGQKYPIRGTVKMAFGGHVTPSQYTLGPEFERAPPSFTKYAKALWARTAVMGL